MRSEGYLERTGVRLHYVEWDSEGPAQQPALLLLHGLSSNALFWSRLAPLLEGRRIVALDQRSHGLSDRPQRGHDAGEVVADAAHAVRELGLGRPVVAGHSWGAAIALELAALHPELAGGLVFVDGPAAPMTGYMTWEEASARMQPPLPVYADVREAEAAQAEYLEGAWGPDLEPFVRAGIVEAGGGGFASTLTAATRLEILRSLYLYQPELLFPKVEGPVLLAMAGRLWEGADPSLVEWRRRSVRDVLELRPDARVRWYDSRHDVPLIRPAELARDLERTALAAGFADVARQLAALDGDWARPAQGDGEGWTARELLAHLSSSQAALPALVEAPLPEPNSPPRPPFDPARWNASQLARREKTAPGDLVLEAQRAAVRVQAALHEADLALDQPTGSFAGVSRGEAMRRMLDHQRQHLGELRAALDGRVPA